MTILTGLPREHEIPVAFCSDHSRDPTPMSAPRQRYRRHSLHRVVACAVLLPALTACASWRVQQEPAQQVVQSRRLTRVRVTTREGEQVVLQEPRVITGILRGYDEECWRLHGVRAERCSEVGFLLSEVEVLEVRQHHRGVLLLGAIAAMGTVIYLVTAI